MLDRLWMRDDDERLVLDVNDDDGGEIVVVVDWYCDGWSCGW